MEKRPFDGLVFKLHAAGGRYFWQPAPLDPKAFEADFADLKAIQWKKFTDNFILVWTAASDKLDWFNDAHWRAVEHNMRLVAKAAHLGRCGIALDIETYLKERTAGVNNIWSYAMAPHRNTRSFAEYHEKVRRRGRRFIQVVQKELPNATIFSYFHISIIRNKMGPMTPRERYAKLRTEQYGLAPAFVAGMLEAADPGVRIIDGNEPAFMYKNRSQFFTAYHLLTHRSRMFFDPAVRQKLRAQGTVGQAAFIDECLGTRPHKTLANYMTPRDRARLLEHNVYWAMYTADQYAWCYDGTIDWWWGKPAGSPAWNKGMPPGCVDAIRAARRKIAAGQPLGFDLKPIMAKAYRRRDTERKGRFQQSRK
jgi:hypothetical protein